MVSCLWRFEDVLSTEVNFSDLEPADNILEKVYLGAHLCHIPDAVALNFPSHVFQAVVDSKNYYSFVEFFDLREVVARLRDEIPECVMLVHS